MKNNHTALFAIGIMVGGVMMSVILGAVQIKDLFTPASPVRPTSQQFPQLIALESERLAQIVTPSPMARAHPTKVALPSAQATPSSEATSLALPNEQETQVIGYSVQGRALTVYRFGRGEQERMIVAGIHGGDEWNTITLANQLIIHLNQNPHVVPWM